jgi:hypothetical protein
MFLFSFQPLFDGLFVVQSHDDAPDRSRHGAADASTLLGV